MPIYEYKCAACGETWEELGKMADPIVTSCPACQRVRGERQISRTTFKLEGSCWEKDGYAK